MSRVILFPGDEDLQVASVVPLRRAWPVSILAGCLVFAGLTLRISADSATPAESFDSLAARILWSVLVAALLLGLSLLVNAVTARRLHWAVLLSLVLHLLVCVGLNLVHLPGRDARSAEAASLTEPDVQISVVADYGDIEVRPTEQPWEQPTDLPVEASQQAAADRATPVTPASASIAGQHGSAALDAPSSSSTAVTLADAAQLEPESSSSSASRTTPDPLPAVTSSISPAPARPADAERAQPTEAGSGRSTFDRLPDVRPRTSSFSSATASVPEPQTATVGNFAKSPSLTETEPLSAMDPRRTVNPSAQTVPDVAAVAIPEAAAVVEMSETRIDAPPRLASAELPNAVQANRTTPVAPAAVDKPEASASNASNNRPVLAATTASVPAATARSTSAVLVAESEIEQSLRTRVTSSPQPSVSPATRQSQVDRSTARLPDRGSRGLSEDSVLNRASAALAGQNADESRRGSKDRLASQRVPSLNGMAVRAATRTDASDGLLTARGSSALADSNAGSTKGRGSAASPESALRGPSSDTGRDRAVAGLPGTAGTGRPARESGRTTSVASLSGTIVGSGNRVSEASRLTSGNRPDVSTFGRRPVSPGRGGEGQIARALQRSSSGAIGLTVTGPQEGLTSGNSEAVRSGNGAPNGPGLPTGNTGSSAGERPGLLLAGASAASRLARRAPTGVPGVGRRSDGELSRPISQQIGTSQDVAASANASPSRGASPRLPSMPAVVAPTPARSPGSLHLRPSRPIDSRFSARTPAARRSAVAERGGTDQSEAAVERGLRWLADHQYAAGNWSIHEPACDHLECTGPGLYHADAAATGLALLAFLGAGHTHQSGDYSPHVQRGLDWLIQQQDSDGHLFETPSEFGQFYSHGIATIALCEAYGMSRDPKLRFSAQRAIDYILKSQHEELGGWRYQPNFESDTSVSGWQLMALRSGQMAGLSVPKSALDRVAGWLDTVESRTEPGRFRYHPSKPVTEAMTAEGLLMRQYLGVAADNSSLKRGAAALLQRLPHKDSPNVYYWYYATQVMFHLQGEYWSRWNEVIRPLLVETQETAGAAAGSWDPERPARDAWARSGGRHYVTCLNLLMLEVYYRHLPLYLDPVSAGNSAQ